MSKIPFWQDKMNDEVPANTVLDTDKQPIHRLPDASSEMTLVSNISLR